jgi:NAD(P)-dependent dehydrogenase (short-subunit alcohol dehydrogenase family)
VKSRFQSLLSTCNLYRYNLASLGARLILSSRRPDTLRRVCEACAAAGAGDARILALDARAGSAAMRAKGAEALTLALEMGCEDEYVGEPATGGVDYLFHVAGGSQHAAAEDTTVGLSLPGVILLHGQPYWLSSTGV